MLIWFLTAKNKVKDWYHRTLWIFNMACTWYNPKRYHFSLNDHSATFDEAESSTGLAVGNFGCSDYS